MEDLSRINAFEVFNSLLGQWNMSRIVSGVANVRGRATFNQINARELHYREEGVFTSLITSRIHNIFQERCFRYIENTIQILFIKDNQPGELLHSLSFTDTCSTSRSAQATSKYFCGRDIYAAHYMFLMDEIRLRYDISGPSKSFTIITELKRL